MIGKAARPTAFGPKLGGWEPSSVHVQYTSNQFAGINAKVFTDWVTNLGQPFQWQMRTKFGEGSSKEAWLLLDNSVTHAHPVGSTPRTWGDSFRFRGFEMTHCRVLVLPPKTTSELQPYSSRFGEDQTRC